MSQPPENYAPGPTAGTLTHIHTGIVVAAERTTSFDVFLAQLGQGELPPPPRPLPDPSAFFTPAAWTLTVPVPRGSDGEARNVTALDRFALPGHFYVDQVDAGGPALVLSAHAGGATTANSDYPRTEFRQRTGGKLAAWSSTSGVHELAAQFAVAAAPPRKPQVVFAQVHNGKRDIVELMYDGRRAGGALVVRFEGRLRSTLRTPYALRTWADLRMRAASGRIQVFLDGILADEMAYRGSGLFFKVGAYVQSNPGQGDAPDAVGTTWLRSLAAADS